MRKSEAARVLRAIVAGCHPETGELLADHDVLANPHVTEALTLAIRSLGGSVDVPATSEANPAEGSVFDAVLARFGKTVSGGPARFTKTGWFYVGDTVAECPSCGETLHGFRKAYESSGREYHYWGLVCLTCERAYGPSELETDARKSVYDSSDLRPGPRTGTAPSA